MQSSWRSKLRLRRTERAPRPQFLLSTSFAIVLAQCSRKNWRSGSKSRVAGPTIGRNTVAISQLGQLDSVSAVQGGTSNNVELTQYGLDETITLHQSGSANVMSVSQATTGASANLTQTGLTSIITIAQ